MSKRPEGSPNQGIDMVDHYGHYIYPGANRYTGKNPLPMYFYIMTLQFQERPGVVGYSQMSGLVIPRDKCQAGEWQTDVLGYCMRQLPTYHTGLNSPFAAGVPLMLHFTLNETYHEPADPSDLVDETSGSWDDEG